MESSAASSALPLILIELVLVFGGVLAFGWWQLHSVKRDRAQMLAERAQRASADPTSAPSASRDVGSAVGSSAGTSGAPAGTSITTPTSTPSPTPTARPITPPTVMPTVRPIDPDRPASSPRSPMP